MRVTSLLLVLPLFVLPACCFERWNETIALTSGVPACGDEIYIAWNEVNEIPDGFFLFVGKSDGGSEDEPVLELFDASGTAVAFPFTVVEDQMCAMGCPRTTASYDVSGLPPGDYTLVHRRRFGSGDMLIVVPGGASIPWSAWEGEQALVATLRIP